MFPDHRNLSLQDCASKRSTWLYLSSRKAFRTTMVLPFVEDDRHAESRPSRPGKAWKQIARNGEAI